MSKFYTPVWKERGMMFIKLLEAAPDKLDAVKINKKGRNTNDIYTREVSPKDWKTPLGYRIKVWSQDEKDTNDINMLTKQNAVKQAMPDNAKVAEIYQRRLLEWADYTPDEINEIMQLEEERRQAIIAQAQALQDQAINGMGGAMSGIENKGALPAPGGKPEQPQSGIAPAPASPMM